MSLKNLIVFPNFRLICSYFVLVTIIIFDLALHISIFIIHVEYFWLLMTSLNEKFHTLILNFVCITFCLLTEPQTMLQLEILMAYTLFYCKVSSELLCILFIHCSFVCQVSIDLIYSHSWSFCVLASSVIIVLKLFLIFG